jgi:hypothetical protein
LTFQAEQLGHLIRILHRKVLGRAPRRDELTYWESRFADRDVRGATRMLELLDRRESYQFLVVRWLTDYLGHREPAEHLADSWDSEAVEALCRGADFNQVFGDLLSSDRYYDLAGGTDIGLIRRFFETVLGRPAEQHETEDWSSQLAGRSRREVTQCFLESDEAARAIVARWFQDYLDRGQSLEDLKALPCIHFWASRLLEYKDHFAVLAELLAQEYLGPCHNPDRSWTPPPGPFCHPVHVQRGSKHSFRRGSPVLATTYFYWYDAASGENVRYPDGASFITHHPPALESVSYQNIDWHERELRDVTAAGIDVILPVYYGTPYSDEQFHDAAAAPGMVRFSDPGLRRLVAARTRLVREGLKPPRIGMFFDTNTLSRFNPKDYYVDLSTFGGKRWFYESIRNFFSHIPASQWACIDGKPLVFIYHIGHAARVDEHIITHVREWFAQDFGVDCYLVLTCVCRAPVIFASRALDHWVKLLFKKPVFAVLAEFLATEEFYVLAGKEAGGFIHRLSDKLLLRAPTPAENETWLEKLKNQPRLSVVQQFLRQEEVLRIWVAGWFRHYLRRLEPVTQIKAWLEISSWVRRLGDGEDPLSVLTDLLAGDEFYAASGNSDDGLVNNLYQQVLDRLFDPAGKANWLNKLRRRRRKPMIAAFLRAQEALRVLIAGWFHYYMGALWPGRVDAEYNWGGALHPEFREVACFGPGYDHSAARDRTSLIVPREGGDRYRWAWEMFLAMNPRPWLVHLETWNELIEGSELCETREFGRHYIELTRHYADRFHAAARPGVRSLAAAG